MGDYSWIGPLVQGVGGLVGSQQQIDAAGQNQALMQDAYKRALALLQSGQLSYSPSQAQGVGPSAMGGVQADPNSVIAQNEALQRLQDASQSGFDAIDRAAINKTMSEANANERGQREAALARLDPNSGAAMAARMSAQSSGANRANQQALDIASASRKRALDALGAFGGMANQMRGQSFNEGAQRAQAQDAISRFNAETSRFNTSAQNAAAENNIRNRLMGQDILTGATGAYAGANTALGGARANQSQGVGNMLGNAVNAGTAKRRDDSNSSGDPGTGDGTGPDIQPATDLKVNTDYKPLDEEEWNY